MKSVDILELIHKGNTTNQSREKVKGKLANYRFFGFVECEIPEDILPNYLKRLEKLNKLDKWVCLQIVAVGDVNEIKKSRENTAFAYGSIAVLAPSTLTLSDWYQVEGVARTVLYDGTGDCCYMSNMTKQGGVWCITPFAITDLDVGSVSEEIEQYIIASASSGYLIKPEKPSNYTAVRAVDEIYTSRLNTVPYATPQEAGVVISSKEETSDKEYDTMSNFLDELFEEESSNVIENKIEENVNKSNNSKPSDLIDWNAVKERRREPYKVVNRAKRAEKTKKYSTLVNLAKSAVVTRDATLDALLEQYGTEREDMYEEDKCLVKSVIDRIRENRNSRPKGVGLSGQAIIKEFVNKHEEAKKVCDNATLGEIILSTDISRICDFMLFRVGIETKPVSLGIDYTAEIKKSVFSIFTDSMNILFAGIYSILVGAKLSEMEKTAEICDKVGLSFIQIVMKNPYILILVNSGLKFLTLETLANAVGVHSSEEEWRLACMLHEVLINDGGSTAFDIAHLIKNKLSFSIGRRGLSRLSAESSLLSEEAKENLKFYVNERLSQVQWNYIVRNFDSEGKCILAREELRRAIKSYVDVGLGAVQDGVLYNTQMLEKDIFIFDKVYELAYVREDVNKAKIEKAILDFEAMKNKEFGISEEDVKAGRGFKLEALQADAVRLIDQNAAVVTGPAGSGKTTTVAAMIYAIQQQNPKKNISLQFAAPTGKAAKRLQEVVGGNVKTMHSLFGVFGNSDSEFLDYTDEDDFGAAQADIYIFDEQAMVDTNLMYKALRKIKKKSQVFFLGDKEQLVAIGDGKPFADFLRFLPTVALSVTKRSAEGSAITGNAKNIIYNSNKYNFAELFEADDFKIIPKIDKDIPDTVLELCKYHLGKPSNISQDRVVSNLGTVDPDDIQVISPVTKDRYIWGCDKLNIMLQDLFNPMVYVKNSSVSFGFESNMTTLRVGSRVIHTTNKYDYRHYSAVVNGKFYMENKAAVMNGDVGHIVGIYDGEYCTEVEPDEGVETTINGYEIKDMKGYYKKGNVIIAVRYYDADEKRDYYILYHGMKVESSSTMSDIVLSYTNLNELQLAYCLTVHKMQGSQAKLVIFVLGTGMKYTFVNRNMIYTAITRASHACYLVGNIQSMEKGRYFESSSARHTALEELTM